MDSACERTVSCAVGGALLRREKSGIGRRVSALLSSAPSGRLALRATAAKLGGRRSRRSSCSVPNSPRTARQHGQATQRTVMHDGDREGAEHPQEDALLTLVLRGPLGVLERVALGVERLQADVDPCAVSLAHRSDTHRRSERSSGWSRSSP